MSAIGDAGIVAYTAPDRAATGVWAMVEDARLAARRDARPEAAPMALDLGPGALDEAQAKTVIQAAGLATPARRVCATRADAIAAFAELRTPLAVKALAADLLHKTEVGGVRLDVKTPGDLEDALDALDGIPRPGGAAPIRYLLEEMAPPGVELIIGGLRDPSFGPAVLVGLGGTAAEAMEDVAIGLAPLGPIDAHALIDGLRGRPLLDGWRGAPAADCDALADGLIAIGNLMIGTPEITELDLNPVRAYSKGLLVLDAAILRAG